MSMTTTELGDLREKNVAELEKLEWDLYSPVSQDWLDNVAEVAEAKQFQQYRLEISNLIHKLRIEAINKIAKNLEANEQDLIAGISSLSETISNFNNASIVLDQMATLIDTIGNVLVVL